MRVCSLVEALPRSRASPEPEAVHLHVEATIDRKPRGQLLGMLPTAKTARSVTDCLAIARFGAGMPFVVTVVPRFKLCGL